jgi:hypothetical protein
MRLLQFAVVAPWGAAIAGGRRPYRLSACDVAMISRIGRPVDYVTGNGARTGKPGMLEPELQRRQDGSIA